MKESISVYYDCDPLTTVEYIEKILKDCDIEYERIDPQDGDDGPIEFKYEKG